MPTTVEILHASALVGRDAELAVVREFLAAGGGCLAISGEAGLGKTALADAAERLALAAGMRVLRPAGDAGAPDGFAVRDTLMRLRVTTSKVADAGRPAGNQAAGEPVLVIVDGVPGPAAGALAFAARRLAGTGTGLLVTSSRPFGADWQPATELRLGPLAGDAAEELLRRAHPHLGPRVRQRILDDARGNPEALVRLPAALSPAQRTGAVPLPGRLPLDGRLRHVFRARVDDLPAATRELLLLCALEPRLDALATALGHDPLDDLAPAERAGLVRLGDGQPHIDFTHPLIAAAVIAGSDATAQAAARARLGAPARVSSLGQNRAEAAFRSAYVTGDLELARATLAELDPAAAASPAARATATLLALNGDGDLSRARARLAEAIGAGPGPVPGACPGACGPAAVLAEAIATGPYPDPVPGACGPAAVLAKAIAAGPGPVPGACPGACGPAAVLAEVDYWTGHNSTPTPLRPAAELAAETGAVGQSAGATDVAAWLRQLVADADRLHAAGAWDDADDRAADAVRLGEEWGYRTAVWAGQRIRGLIAAARGRRVEPSQDRQVHALAALTGDDPETAYQLLRGIRPGLMSFDLTEAALRTGRADAAGHHPGAGANASNLAFDRALSRAGRRPFDAARIHLCYGEHLRRTGAPGRARDHLAAAVETFQRLGARPWAVRAARELRAAGRTPPATVITIEPPVLSAQERLIAQLAATGLTNKQIAEQMYLSHRTVGAYLYRVFPKLGVTSRAALRDALSTVSPVVSRLDVRQAA